MYVLNPDIINSCRVCRMPNQEGDYQCLFETGSDHEEINMDLTESGILYEKLLDITLNERNYYPKFLCNSCHLQMKLFIKLKDKAQKTLEYLQSIYEGVETVKQETVNYNHQSHEQEISPNEPNGCQNFLDEYQLKGYDIYQQNDTSEYAENIVEQLDTTTTNYDYQTVDIEKELDKLRNNQVSAEQVQQINNSITANIDNNFEIDMKVETDSLGNKRLAEIERDPQITEEANSEEQFPDMKIEPVLDKNVYVTEIYDDIIDDERELEETYLENQTFAEDVIDYNSASEVNTETSSTYNDIEYLLDEETDDLEDVANLEETKIAAKRRRLNKECIRNKSYECLSCQLTFKNLQMYKLHRIECHNENFTCSTCSKEFQTVTALQRHVKSQHNGEPAFQCDICLKTFNQKVHYQYHMNHHNNVRNYKCDLCEKAFIAKSDLKTHQRLHTGERPYVCNVCGKDYLMMEHLKAHFLTHTEQSFPCQVCNKNFTTHKTLRLHVRTIHEDEPRFSCSFCLKPFRRKHHLEYHLKSHEKNFKKLEMSGVIMPEPDNLEDITEDAIDDTGLIFLA